MSASRKKRFLKRNNYVYKCHTIKWILHFSEILGIASGRDKRNLLKMICELLNKFLSKCFITHRNCINQQ